jgi:hypothetical protein
MVVNGWTLLFHEAIFGQLKNLANADQRARKADPKNYRSNANVKLFAALAKLMLEVIPADPGRPEYRQGNTLDAEYRHWFRAKFFGRFRLFFRTMVGRASSFMLGSTTSAACASVAAGAILMKCSGACWCRATRRPTGRRWSRVPASCPPIFSLLWDTSLAVPGKTGRCLHRLSISTQNCCSGIAPAPLCRRSIGGYLRAAA